MKYFFKPFVNDDLIYRMQTMRVYRALQKVYQQEIGLVWQEISAVGKQNGHPDVQSAFRNPLRDYLKGIL